MGLLPLSRWAFVLVLMLVACLVSGQSTRNSTPPKPPKAKNNEAPPAQPLQLGETYPDFDVPDSWPAPADKPAGSADVAAFSLAKSVVAGGAGSLPALQRAALESGFAIYDDTGKYKYLPAPESDLGLAISELELAMVAELMKRKEHIPFADFKNVYAKDAKLKEMNLPSLLVKSLGKCACSVHPGKRFLATFVRAIGVESKGIYELVASETPNFEVSSAQFTWLCLLSAGEVFAGRQKPVEPPEWMNLPARGPFVSDAHSQNSSLSMRTSLQIVRQLGQGAIANHIQQAATQGTDPETALLELSLAQIYRLGISITGSLNNPPLVRTKVKGQEGGDRTLNVQLNFRISDRARAQMQRALAAANATHPLPPNGPLNRDYELFHGINGNIHIANDPVWRRQSAPGKYTLLLRGDIQIESFSNDAVPRDTTADLRLWVEPPVTSGTGVTVPGRLFKIPIRDWRHRGFSIDFVLMAKGSGSESYPDTGVSVRWSISRYISGSATLNTSVPFPMMKRAGQNYDPSATSQFMSWLRSPTASPVRTVNVYEVRDSFVWTIPPDGCLTANDEPSKEFRSTTTSRNPAGPSEELQLTMGNYLCQIDSRARTLSATIPGDVKVPVREEQTDSPTKDRVLPVFDHIRFDNTFLQNYSMQLPTKVWDFPLQGGQPVPNLPGYKRHEISLASNAVCQIGGINKSGDENITVSGSIIVWESQQNTPSNVEQLVHDFVSDVLGKLVSAQSVPLVRARDSNDLASAIKHQFRMTASGDQSLR